MGVPSRLAGHHLALHGVIARDHVLDDAGQHMTDVRLAVRRGRAVIEYIRLPLASAVNALFKNVIFLPEAFDRFFPIDKMQIGLYRLIHKHCPP